MTSRGLERMDLEAAPSSVGQARRFVSEALRRWGLEPLVDTVALLTSELATNAVLHARTAFCVVVSADADDVRVEVLDGSPVVPRRRANSATAATGRGVALVEHIARDWGATPPDRLRGHTKGVWFTVSTSADQSDTWGGEWLQGLEA